MSDVCLGGTGRPEVRVHESRLRRWPDDVLPDTTAIAAAVRTITSVSEDYGPKGN